MNRRKFLKYLPLSLLGLVVPSTLLGEEVVKKTDKDVARYIGERGYIAVHKEHFEELKRIVTNSGCAVRYVNKDVIFWVDDNGKLVEKQQVSVTCDDKDIDFDRGWVNYIPKINPICKHIRERDVNDKRK